MANRIPGPHVPLVDDHGRVSVPWYQFFNQGEHSSDKALAGEVVAGTGLTGGGIVADGVTIGLADETATSVLGRSAGTDGPPASIAATADHQILMREGGMMAFLSAIEGVTIGAAIKAAGTFTDATADNLKLTGTPAVSLAVTTHKIAITCAGVTYYMLLSNV